MEEHNLYLPLLDILINKGPEPNNIWMDIFCNETNTPRCVPLTLVTPNSAKAKYILHLLDEFSPQWRTAKLLKNV